MIKLPAYILIGLIAFLVITGIIGFVLVVKEIINYYKLEEDCKEEK